MTRYCNLSHTFLQFCLVLKSVSGDHLQLLNDASDEWLKTRKSSIESQCNDGLTRSCGNSKALPWRLFGHIPLLVNAQALPIQLLGILLYGHVHLRVQVDVLKSVAYVGYDLQMPEHAIIDNSTMTSLLVPDCPGQVRKSDLVIIEDNSVNGVADVRITHCLDHANMVVKNEVVRKPVPMGRLVVWCLALQQLEFEWHVEALTVCISTLFATMVSSLFPASTHRLVTFLFELVSITWHWTFAHP